MLVENCFSADTRVRNEAATLAENGFKVSVIALRGSNEAAREEVGGAGHVAGFEVHPAELVR